jgi:hypothetical protein
VVATVKLSFIVAGVLFLVVWGLMQIPTFTAEWGWITFDAPNPLHLVGVIILWTLPFLTITISLVMLGITVLIFVVGIVGK